MPVSLAVRDLRVRYGDVTALDGISLDVPQKSGPDLTLPQSDPDLLQQVSTLYERTGGTLVK